MCNLHHVAMAISEFDRYTELFEKLGMTVKKTRGEAPHRELWFHEGLQLKEVSEALTGSEAVDHIALGVDSKDRIKKIALDNGCTPCDKGDKWFALPNGVLIELMEE